MIRKTIFQGLIAAALIAVAGFAWGALKGGPSNLAQQDDRSGWGEARDHD